MIGFIILLSSFLCLSFVWLMGFGLIISKKGGWVFLKALSGADFLAYWISFLLPVFMILTAFCFIYIALEIKKNQLFFKDWLKALKGEVHDIPPFLMQEKEIPKELIPKPEKKVVKINKNEPLERYMNLEPDDGTDYQFSDEE